VTAEESELDLCYQKIILKKLNFRLSASRLHFMRYDFLFENFSKPRNRQTND